MIQLIEELTGRKARVDYRPGHPADVPTTWADISKAGRLLDWEAANQLPAGHAEFSRVVRRKSRLGGQDQLRTRGSRRSPAGGRGGRAHACSRRPEVGGYPDRQRGDVPQKNIRHPGLVDGSALTDGRCLLFSAALPMQPDLHANPFVNGTSPEADPSTSSG